MSDDHNCLQRAHQLSAEASFLVRPPDAPTETLNKALEAYKEAAELFERAGTSADEATRRTLRMLTTQHRKLARDLERRISNVGRPSPVASPTRTEFTERRGSTPPAPGSSGSGSALPRRASLGNAVGAQIMGRTSSSGSGAGSGVGLAAGRGGVLGGPSAVHATAARSVPPFSLRPVGDTPPVSPPAPHVPGVTGYGSLTLSPRSPLYSSSSSSEPPEDSYLFPGHVPDTADPFSRFWGMLENMLEEISIPRALTTAQLGGPLPPAPVVPAATTRTERRAKRAPSPSESFYVVPRGQDRPPRNSSPSAKTNEELMLENESLRASLDALAKHAHALELANKAVTERAEERDKVVRSVVYGVRKEAKKVKHDQEVMRSQILASTSGLPPGQATQAVSSAALVTAQRRVGELEAELKRSEAELRQSKDNEEKLRSQLDKFKEKWDKLRAKKEAKVAAAKGARAGKGPDPV
ncbi:uncharacterized protein LOC62_02G003161 [Vanrija pseudolonga]|uniref:MIT domain-containing protein n=1 Tax=Vanrija pseudolonga TaxID=143232 RepID=A0AAF0Y3I7_9TREE|nr:hypothetical protein LOC62_02G003161 [Vanrija pseudolonga]